MFVLVVLLKPTSLLRKPSKEAQTNQLLLAMQLPKQLSRSNFFLLISLSSKKNLQPAINLTSKPVESAGERGGGPLVTSTVPAVSSAPALPVVFDPELVKFVEHIAPTGVVFIKHGRQVFFFFFFF